MTAPVETALADRTAAALRQLPALAGFKVYANWGEANARPPYAEGGCREPRTVDVYVRPRRHEAFTTAVATVEIELAAHPAFVAATNAVVAAGVATAEEVAALLAASRDFAVPDELFAAFYARAMSNAAGRVSWHGKAVSNSFDTAVRTKTTTYADGFAWTQPFTSVETRSRDEHISAAERKARREEARRRAAEAAERKRLERIATLTTNMEAEVRALMAAKRWPDELARIYLQTELNKLQTNDVSMTFGPGAGR